MSCIAPIAIEEPLVSPAPSPTSILLGDALDRLGDLHDGVVQCCVTSPPYYRQRNYGSDPAEIGQEDKPEAYVAKLVGIFREVRRVLRQNGTLWLNVGDSYATQAGGGGCSGALADRAASAAARRTVAKVSAGLKRKDLIGIPWMLAFALRADGWWLRDDIIWSKSNPMPQSVRDRCTSAHEHVFMLSRSPLYYFNAAAIEEQSVDPGRIRSDIVGGNKGAVTRHSPGPAYDGGPTRNARNVWTMATQPFAGAHHACMPPKLAERCILAGSAPGDLVLDPFLGAATTALAANRIGRLAVGIELNPAYVSLAQARLESAGFASDVY